jgi:ParB-like chromosome segregation protein Spo0J
MTITNAQQDLLPFHPLANNFPLMNGAEFAEFVADIKTRGQIEPIITYDGMILDGRNRYRACLKNKIEPVLKAGDDWIDDPAAYVRSANIHRRHLKAKDKREAIAKLLKESPEKSDREIGRLTKTDNKTVASVRGEEEAREEIPHVSTRTDTRGRKQAAKKSTKKADRKQPVRKPVKHDDRVISPELRERVGRFAYRLIRLDINLARELADLILQRGVAERLWNDLDTGIEIEGNGADPETSAEARKAKFAALDDGADPKERAF